MVYTPSTIILQSLFLQGWYLPLLVILTFAVHYFTNPKAAGNKSYAKTNLWCLGFWGFLLFVAVSAPFWMFGDNAAHSTSDDLAHTLQTYLSSSRGGDTINWTNGLLGGMDRWLLPNCHPLAFGRIYALFLKPYQLYLLVIAINVISVFIFSWRIQTEFWGMRPWTAYFGAIIAVFTEGYWAADGHIAQGHGFAMIIIGVYWLTRFHESSKLWLVALLTALVYSFGSWTPFHNLPPLLATITLWGLIFWGRDGWLKVIQVNALIILTVFTVLFPVWMAIKLLLPLTARGDSYRGSVVLNEYFVLPEVAVAALLVFFTAVLKVYNQKITRQVLVFFLGLCLVPFIAYAIQSLKIVFNFRWELLYRGNEAWIWMAVIFFLDMLQLAVADRFRWGGIALRLLIFSSLLTLVLFAWMDSLWFDLDSSYPAGNWKTLTETATGDTLKIIDPSLGRVVGIDDTNDMHFWGQYQGVESIIGYTPFIDARKAYFWWYAAALPSSHGALYATGLLSLPIPVKDHLYHLDFSVPLPFLVNPDALRVANVHWIVSHHPLYPMPGLAPIIEQPGDAPACSDRGYAPSHVDLKELRYYWDNIACHVKDFKYQRPFYVYELEGALPRAYIAAHVASWPTGQKPVLTQQELPLAAKGAAFLNGPDWHPVQDQGSWADVQMLDYHSDYMRLGISAGQDGLLVLSSTLNPYWRILVDGKRVNSFDVNGFQTGFWVHPQDKQAELIYCPPLRPRQHPYCSRG